MTIEEKNELLDRLSVCYNRVNYCKILCEENGKTEEAKQFERRKKRLKLKIESLLHDLYENWIGSAKDLKGKVEDANAEIERLVKDIENDIKQAQKIVKIFGYVDDVIKLAAGLVKLYQM